MTPLQTYIAMTPLDRANVRAAWCCAALRLTFREAVAAVVARGPDRRTTYQIREEK